MVEESLRRGDIGALLAWSWPEMAPMLRAKPVVVGHVDYRHVVAHLIVLALTAHHSLHPVAEWIVLYVFV